VPYRVYIGEPPTLLDDLLEDSSRVYHGRCAVIQRAFHERWLETLGAAIGQEQIEHADDAPAAVEARARLRLRPVWVALRDGKRELILRQEAERAARDEAISAYVASLGERREPVAA
jgi:hypothetical protein